MPPKRAGQPISAARPAKRSTSKLSPVLTEASTVLPQAEFVKLIKKHVLPGLDDEAFKDVFQQAIVKFKTKDAVDQKIKLEDHKKSIKQHAKELKSSLRHHWHDGHEDQVHIKHCITGEVLEWLNDLFEVAIEGGTQLAITQKCLMFMEDQVVAIMDDNCRVDFYDCCDPDYTVSNSTGETRYDGSPDTVIPRFWRDLLLMAVIHNDTAVINSYKAHSSSDGAGSYLSDVLACTRHPDHPQLNKAADRCEYDDDWHTAAMKAAGPKLRAMLEK